MDCARWSVAVLALGLAVGCIGGDANNPLETANGKGNEAPVIKSITVEPPTVSKGGKAVVTVVATDLNNDGLTFVFTALHGRCDPGPPTRFPVESAPNG